MADPAIKKKVEAAKGVAYHLLKGIKMIGMYRHNEAKYGEFLTKAHEALAAYTGEFGPLVFQVDMTNFLLHKTELFSEDNPMPYKFYKDGIRQIIFRDGFTLEELTTFTLIALSDPDRGADDINTQLWRAQLPNLEYIMVEGFKMDEASDEEVQVEVDQVVSALQRRLRADSDDYLRFARVSEEDLEMKLSDVEQMRGVVVQGVTADATLKAKVQKEIFEEENQRLFPKLISAVFQVVESGIDDADLLSDMFTQLLDAMLLQEDFAIINQVVLKLKAMEQRAGAGTPAAKLHKAFLNKMGEEQRLNRIGDILKSTKPKSPQDLVRYLSSLGMDTVSLLLNLLDVIELPENRALLCDVLVPCAREYPEPFVGRLESSDRPQMQRDMVYVLDRSNHPDKLKFFGMLLKSKNLALRLEAMSIIAKGRTGEARRMIASMLADDNMQVRIQAARVLPEFDRDQAYLDLMKLVKDPLFQKRTGDEQEAIYAAIGATGVPGALAWFVTALQQKAGLFNKQKVLEEKLRAIAGLGGAATIQTAKLLQEAAEDKAQPPEVQSHAKLHLGRVRKQLFGSSTTTGREG